MDTQDGKSDQVLKSGGWTVSDAGEPSPEQGTKTPRTSTSKPRTGSTRRKAKPKSSDTKPTTTAAKPKTTAAKPKTTAAKPKTAATKPKTSATKPKTTAAKPKTGTSKPKTTKPKTTKPKTSKPKTTKRKTSRRKQSLADLVGELLARRASGGKEGDSVLGPILEHLTKNMGLSPETSQAVVGYVLEKLLKRQQEKAASASTSGEAGASAGQAFDLDGFLQQTRCGPIVELTPAASGDDVGELAHDADLDPATAEASLNQVLKMLGVSGL
jgi:hypothetical protein